MVLQEVRILFLLLFSESIYFHLSLLRVSCISSRYAIFRGKMMTDVFSKRSLADNPNKVQVLVFLWFGLTRSIFLLCLQDENSSLLLLSVAPSGAKAMRYFSRVQSAQIPEIGLNILAFSTISQLISQFMFSSLSVCVSELSVVWLLSSWLNV